MTRINTNVASLIGQHTLARNNQMLDVSLERLSTGLRINRGKDDPAGLIASENLRAEKTALSQAIGNAERADQVANIAEGGLDEISRMLNELQGLITQTANDGGLSVEEKQANQLQIDSILQTVDRLADSTSFQGVKLLNGNFDYDVENVDAAVLDYQVNGAKLSHGETRGVDVTVYGSAQVAGYFLSFGGTALDLTNADDRFVVEIAGSLGSRELSFASGATLNDVVAAVNSFSDVTGVEASVSGTGIRLESSELGSAEFVGLTVVDDGNVAAGDGIHVLSSTNALEARTAATAGFSSIAAENGLRDFGQDVSVAINGIIATTKGSTARINTDFLDVEIELLYDPAGGSANAAILGNVDAFDITGGGADFQLAGQVDIAGRVSIGIQAVAARKLGRAVVNVGGTDTTYHLNDLTTGADLNVVSGNLDAAQKVVTQAIKEISVLRGRIGAFQSNTIGATIRSLGIGLENTTAAESTIRDADFATETASLTRNQILSNSATQILTIANSQPQNALQLLG